MKARRTLLLGFLLLALCGSQSASAAIDELAFGTTPQVMVYLFAVDEVSKIPDSPYTLKRVDSAVKFCRGRISAGLMESLVEIQQLLHQKKPRQAQEKARMLLAMTYGE